MIIEHSINVRPALTEAGQIQVSAKALLLQNTGTVDAYLNTHCTIKAGGTLQIAPFPAEGILKDELSVTFSAAVGTKRLEVIEIQNNQIIC